MPDLRLFVRGDEVEVHRRLARSGLPYGTCLTTAYVHPDGSAEFKPMLGGRLHAQDPGDATKRYYTYRNRGYLLAQPGLRRFGAIEHLRFAWYFLVSRRDPAGLREWLSWSVSDAASASCVADVPLAPAVTRSMSHSMVHLTVLTGARTNLAAC